MNDHFTPDLFRARLERDSGIKRSVDHADAVFPSWSSIALDYVRQYCLIHSRPFIADELSQWAYRQGLPEPPNRMAWGSVMVQARKAGIVTKLGYRNSIFSNVKNHMKPVVEWTGALK